MEIKHKLPVFVEQNLFNLIVLGLLSLIYSPLLFHWIDGWLNKSINIEHEYFSYALIGFPFAAYIVWNNRDKWEKLDNKYHPVGISLLVIAAIFYGTGVREFVNISFPLMLTGICLCLKGIAGLKLHTFPLLLVWLATPNSIPYLLTPYTLPLQKFIANFAGFLLIQLGIDVQVEEIYLAVGGRLVEVAPYCAGLKMLFTSLYVALILLYWTDNLSQKKKISLMLIGTVAISVFGNIIRNTLLTYFHGMGHDQMFDLIHEGWGGDVYSAIMLGFVMLLMQQIDKLPINQEQPLINEE